MRSKSIFGFLVAILAFLAVLPAVSAFAEITSIEVNGIDGFSGQAGVFAGETMTVRVTITADETQEEVRVIARILGEPGLSAVTEEFAVINGSTYSRLLHIDLPIDLDEDLNEQLTLEVTVEDRNAGLGDREEIDLELQRENNFLQILSVEADNEAKAGETIALDVVARNIGRHKADAVFARALIPSLGITKSIFLGDLYAQDHRGQNGENEEDTALGRVYLTIPRDAPAGVYNVEIEVYNGDSSTMTTKKVVVIGSGADSEVISSRTTKTFAVGEEQVYTVTIVNADDTIKVYELILETANGLAVNVDESLVAVPAGTSKTFTLRAVASEEGNYNFAVNIHSDGELVKKQNFVANVEGKTSAGNAAVVLTIILAIVFVVLLIVLIVLLTRKPEKSEDFGESYY